MYEKIIAILDKAKAENVDLLTARDMLVTKDKVEYAKLKEASKFIQDYYDTITKCRRLSDNDTIKALVEADDKRRKEIVKEVADINE